TELAALAPVAAPWPATPMAPRAPVPPASGDGWLRVIEATQQQAAEAHAEFQRAMTESHLAYLRMAEMTFAGVLSTATGEAPPAPGRAPRPPPQPVPPQQAPRQPVPAQQVPLQPVPAQQVPGQAPAVLPAAPAVAAVAALDEPAVGPPPGSAAGAAPDVPAEPRSADKIGALLLEVVADRTGYPVDMLNVDMELDNDLGIDSIKKVEILSAVRERVGDLPSGDMAAFAALRTLRAIAEEYAQLGSGANGGQGRLSLVDPA